MLFGRAYAALKARFSALQRAENSSITRTCRCQPPLFWFQCSSASRKFLNVVVRFHHPAPALCFSALQRAENSSIGRARPARRGDAPFQCSSASRKFLNRLVPHSGTCGAVTRFSALQRAENSSIRWPAGDGVGHIVTFQCSSASRKFLNAIHGGRRRRSRRVSVLFSEPKIPQSRPGAVASQRPFCFSALQRAENSSMERRKHEQHYYCRFSALQQAENSSMVVRAHHQRRPVKFQCSSASRKFLNVYYGIGRPPTRRVSVLFSEPKIPQSLHRNLDARASPVSVLFSEPKIPQLSAASGGDDGA